MMQRLMDMEYESNHDSGPI